MTPKVIDPKIEEKFKSFKDSGKKFGGMLILVIVVIFVATAIFRCFYTVGEQEKALVLRFGKIIATKSAGLSFKLPIDRIVKVDIKTRGMQFGYTHSDNQDISTEDAISITSDSNFIHTDFYIEWRVVNPEKYLIVANDVEAFIYNLMRAGVKETINKYPVDEVLTTAKTEIETDVKEYMFTQLQNYDMGVEIKNITLQDTEPPTPEIIAAFKNVENARQNKDTKVNVANQYLSEELPKARAEADKLIQNAEAQKQARINEAMGQVERFNKLYEEYAKNPQTTKTRIYLETMENILPSVKVIIDSGEATLKYLPIGGTQ